MWNQFPSKTVYNLVCYITLVETFFKRIKIMIIAVNLQTIGYYSSKSSRFTDMIIN